MPISSSLWIALALALSSLWIHADLDEDTTSLLEPQQHRCYVPSKNGLLWLLNELGPDGPVLTDAHDKAMNALLKSGKLDDAMVQEITPLVPKLRQLSLKALEMPYWQSKWRASLSDGIDEVFEHPAVNQMVKVLAVNVVVEARAGRWDAAIKDFKLLDRLGCQFRNHASDGLECLMGAIVSHRLDQVVAAFIQIPDTPSGVLKELAAELDANPYLMTGWQESLRHEFRLRRLQCTGIHNLDEYWVRFAQPVHEKPKHDFPPKDVKAINDHFSYFYDEKKTLALLETRYSQMVQMADEAFTTEGHPSFHFKDGLKRPIEDWSFPNALGTGLVVYFPTNEKALKLILRRRSCHTMMRTALAVELYRRAQGKLPERLEDLIPRYHQSLPKDSLDGAVISYDANQGLLYTAGEKLQRDPPAIPETPGLKLADSGDVFRFTK